jgi:hypothetical protein
MITCPTNLFIRIQIGGAATPGGIVATVHLTWVLSAPCASRPDGLEQETLRNGQDERRLRGRVWDRS